MKLDSYCIPCLKGLAEKTIRLSGAGNEELIKTSHHLIEELRTSGATPPSVSNTLLRKIREWTGVPDPYRAIKEKEYLEARQAFRATAPLFGDALEEVIRLSALGNSMDFFVDGPYGGTECYFTAHMAKIENAIYTNSKDVLILGDNIGDFVFDMPLVAHLEKKGKQVHYAVRERPVQNDLSLEDVERFRLDDLFANIVSTGFDEVGLTRERISGTVKTLWESNAVVIAKGMGNFETISEFSTERPVVHVMKIKCPAVARAVGQDKGTYTALVGGE